MQTFKDGIPVCEAKGGMELRSNDEAEASRGKELWKRNFVGEYREGTKWISMPTGGEGVFGKGAAGERGIGVDTGGTPRTMCKWIPLSEDYAVGGKDVK